MTSTPRSPSAEWAISRSSMLTPSSPASVVTSASTPGRSGTGTRTSTRSSGRDRRVGRFRLASRARSRMLIRAARSPPATTSRTFDRSVASWSNAVTMAAAFSAQMSGQIPGWPAATRVMSRNPPAASRSSAPCCSAPSEASPMRAAAVRWGTCDTTATRSSCRSGGTATTSAPRDVTTARRRVNTSGSVDAVGVSTHVAPANSSRSAPSIPSCSEPAIG